jgi:hypothetical protein
VAVTKAYIQKALQQGFNFSFTSPASAGFFMAKKEGIFVSVLTTEVSMP